MKIKIGITLISLETYQELIASSQAILEEYNKQEAKVRGINAGYPKNPGEPPNWNEFKEQAQSNHGKVNEQDERAWAELNKDYEDKKRQYDTYKKQNQAAMNLYQDLRYKKMVLEAEIGPSSIILDEKEDLDEETLKKNLKLLGISEENIQNLWKDLRQVILLRSAIDLALKNTEGASQSEVALVRDCQSTMARTDITAAEKIQRVKRKFDSYTEEKPSHWFFQLLQWIAKALGIAKQYRSIIKHVQEDVQKKTQEKPSEEPGSNGGTPPHP